MLTEPGSFLPERNTFEMLSFHPLLVGTNGVEESQNVMEAEWVIAFVNRGTNKAVLMDILLCAPVEDSQ